MGGRTCVHRLRFLVRCQARSIRIGGMFGPIVVFRHPTNEGVAVPQFKIMATVIGEMPHNSLLFVRGVGDAGLSPCVYGYSESPYNMIKKQPDHWEGLPKPGMSPASIRFSSLSRSKLLSQLCKVPFLNHLTLKYCVSHSFFRVLRIISLMMVTNSPRCLYRIRVNQLMRGQSPYGPQQINCLDRRHKTIFFGNMFHWRHCACCRCKTNDLIVAQGVGLCSIHLDYS